MLSNVEIARSILLFSELSILASCLFSETYPARSLLRVSSLSCFAFVSSAKREAFAKASFSSSSEANLLSSFAVVEIKASL